MKHTLAHLPRILLITMLLMLSGLVLKAQTKEETLKWIKDKINKYGKNIIIPVSPGNDKTYNVSLLLNDLEIDTRQFVDGVHYTTVGHLNINDIVSATPYIMTESGIPPMYYIRIRTNGRKIAFSKSQDNLNGPPDQIVYTEQIDMYLDGDAEVNLFNRFAKAMDKLIFYNNKTRPKETF